MNDPGEAIDNMHEANWAAATAGEIDASSWRPIETAPRDWSGVILFDEAYENDGQKVFEGFFDCEEHIWRDRQCTPVKPTRWMPLPKPPKS